MVDIVIPTVLFISCALVLFSFFYYSYQAKRRQQETIQKLIDNGQALSPELITSIAKPAQSLPSQDFSRGILLIAIAIAIVCYGWFAIDYEPEFMGLGFFPLTIGLAYLLIWKFRPNDER